MQTALTDSTSTYVTVRTMSQDMTPRPGDLPAAGPAAALAAAPAYSSKQADVTFVDARCEKSRKSPSIQLAENARKVGGTHVFLRSIGEFDCDSGYTGDKAPASPTFAKLTGTDTA